jgi:hypothetical protein
VLAEEVVVLVWFGFIVIAEFGLGNQSEGRTLYSLWENRMSTRLGLGLGGAHAQAVRNILKSKATSRTPFTCRNPLRPLFSRARDTPRFLIALLHHQKPLLSRPCSFHHHPPASAPAMSSNKALDNYRLPTDSRPRHYDLIIRTDLEKEKFTGLVKIE